MPRPRRHAPPPVDSRAERPVRPSATGGYVRLIGLGLAGAAAVPVVTALATCQIKGIDQEPVAWAAVLWLAGVGLASWYVFRARRTVAAAVEATAQAQARFLDELPARWLDAAIAGTAATSLVLELAVIRWQGTVFEFFAFYKNFALLASFAGLGLGYALSSRGAIALVLTGPLLGVQLAMLLGIRYGMGELNESLLYSVFLEQASMGVFMGGSAPFLVAVYSFLAVVFLLTALALVPVGQLCGRLMRRRAPLRAYGLNLLGSVAGVAVFSGLSFLWTPPAAWFGVGLAGLAPFLTYGRGAAAAGTAAAIACLAVAAWPGPPEWSRVYSPYQMLEVGPAEPGGVQIRAAGTYYQRILDLRPANANRAADALLARRAAYYEAPYRFCPRAGARVAVLGAGSGNDVAAALRSGVGHVDAVEIDPAILALGRAYHPERPYGSDRVTPIVDDARTFLRRSTAAYDMIVYGLLDSHTLLSHASSVRIDSFVYTVEGLREARARLAEGGVLSLSFSVLSPELGRKLYLMMSEAFDGRPPVVVWAGYDGAAIFLQSKEGDLRVPEGFFEETGLEDAADRYPDVPIDLATDDWPFFYMPQRVYPRSYLPFVAVVGALSAAMTWSLGGERPGRRQAAFFFLGAGFMLVETKAITELGLVFGNTWLVIGVAIAAILLMAFLANACVQGLGVRGPVPVAVLWGLLLASLAGGLLVARSGGLPATPLGRAATVALLTCPILFSGMLFSAQLAGTKDVGLALGSNILGAMAGGLLEYNSMYFGFRALYLLAMGLYVLAWVASRGGGGGSAPAAVAA